MPLFSTPFLVRGYGWTEMVAGFRASWKRLLLVGVIALIAYVTVVVVYSFAPVNYSEAIREVSVVLGAFFGWYFLGEEMGKVRVVGAVAIFAGVALIAVLG